MGTKRLQGQGKETLEEEDGEAAQRGWVAYKGRAGWAREGTGRGSGQEGVGTEAKGGTGGF